MLPGKTYKPEDALKILRKRIWLVVVPWAVVAAGTAAVARKLPDVFAAEATIQVVPPRVPDNLLRQANNVRLEERLQAISAPILSRTRLERLIQEYDLYRQERQTEIMEDVVQKMSNAIAVQPLKGDAFKVRYIGRDPVTVMKITEKLAGFFIEESLRDGEKRAEGTSAYIDAQVEEAKRQLEANENALKQYQISHAGEMPDQAMANIQAIQNLQMQIQQVTTQINNAEATKLQLEREITNTENMTDPRPASAGADSATLPIAQQLAAAKNMLSLMLVSKKPDNPDVQAQQRLVNSLQKLADAEGSQATVGAAAAQSPFEAAKARRLVDLRDALDLVKKQIVQRHADEARLRGQVDIYQARVNAVPARSAELISITRDYNTLNKTYQDLLAQREAAKMSVNLENRQLGERFTLIDQARLPQRPDSPNRILINFAGIVGGLALGLLLVALVEYRDTTFKTDRELASVLALPVLAVVPLMLSDAERRAQFRRKLITNLGLGSAVAACVAVLAYTFLFVR